MLKTFINYGTLYTENTHLFLVVHDKISLFVISRVVRRLEKGPFPGQSKRFGLSS